MLTEMLQSMLSLVHRNWWNAMMVWILGGHTLQDATKQQVEKSVKMHQRNEELREPWNHFFEVAVDYDEDADDDDSARVSPPPLLDVKDLDDLDTNASMLHLVHSNRCKGMIVVWILRGHFLGDATKEQLEKSVKIHHRNEGSEWYKYYK